jgi:hypothetical protein
VPSPSAVAGSYVEELVQDPKVGWSISVSLASSAHWRTLCPATLKVNFGFATLVEPEGPVRISTVGGVPSTLKDRVAGVASMFPTWSTARTAKV